MQFTNKFLRRLVRGVCVAFRGAEARTFTGPRSSPCTSRPARRPGPLASASVQRTRLSGGTSRKPRKALDPWPPGARRMPPAGTGRMNERWPRATGSEHHRVMHCCTKQKMKKGFMHTSKWILCMFANQRGGARTIQAHQEHDTKRH